MKLGIYARHIEKEINQHYVVEFVEYLIELKCELYVHERVDAQLKLWKTNINVPVFDSDKVTSDSFEVLLSLGGDGTVLDTLRIVRDTGIPVLGVNIGRFGFLANLQQEDFKKHIEALRTGAFSIDQRSVLRCVTDEPYFGDFPYSLNDVIVHKKDTSSMITVHAWLGDEALNSYWADGLILATPTGSSGYSLSCGGPILFPGSTSFVLTPIAPHNLTMRPLVISDEHTLSFEIEGRTDEFLVTMDSASYPVPSGTRLTVEKAPFTFNMIQFEGKSYAQTIRNKLLWGVDKRN